MKILKRWDFYFLSSVFLLGIGLLLTGIGQTDQVIFSWETPLIRVAFLFLAVGICLHAKELVSKISWKQPLLYLVLIDLLFLALYPSAISLKKVFLTLGFYVFFEYSVFRDLKMKPVAWQGVFILVLCLLLLLPVFLVPFSDVDAWFRHLDGSFRGGFIHRNALGYFGALLLIAAVRFCSKKVQFLFFPFYFAVLAASQSRTFFVASAMIFFFTLIKRWRLLFVAGLAHVIVLLFWTLPGMPVGGERDTRVYETSNSERIQLLKAGWEKYLQHPWAGARDVVRVNSEFNSNSDVANFYLSHLITYGLFQTISMLCLFVFIYRRCTKSNQLVILTMAIFGMFQAFFDYLQSSYFLTTLLVIYSFSVLDSRDFAGKKLGLP